jgi:outer membrane receptor for ferrienterochelin and colicins
VGVADAFADWAGIEATLGHKTGRQRITLGTTYERDFRVDQRVHEIGKPPVLDDRRTSWLVGAYGETELILLPKFTIRAGGRLDWFDTFGGALSPRAAAIYSPTSRTSLKYIFSRAFRAPSAYESHYHDNYLFVSPVHHLNPEHIHSNEVALERTLFQWLQLTADAFYNNINNIIEPQLDPASGLLRFGNGGTDRGRGLEFELDAKSASGFAGRVSYTLADAKDGLTGVNLGNSPMHTAKLNAMIPVSRKGFLGAEMLYSSAQTSFQQTRVSPSFLTNLTLSTKQLWGGWEFSASCYNAFDRRWFTPDGPKLRQAEIQQDGRTYRFKVTYRLGRERRK